MNIEIVTPYFCFYSGSLLLGKIKSDAQRGGGQKAELISEFCQGMDSEVFTARKNLVDKTMHGQPCIEAYNEVYSSELALKFDPISTEVAPRAMCAEFVKEINTLLDMNRSSLNNATRYSYLISQQVDLETQQVDTFASCIEK